MIHENFGKVKYKIQLVCESFCKLVSKPQRKFLLEFSSGLLSCKSANLSEVSRSLKEPTDIKHVVKRLGRNVVKYSKLAEIINTKLLQRNNRHINEKTFIYLDGGDLTYSQATSYEKMGKVYDGSTGGIGDGYPLNMIVCRNGATAPIPMFLEVFHRNDGYTSDTTTLFNLIDKFIKTIGRKGVWVMDRGFDSKGIMEYLLKKACRFVIRQTGKRHVIDNGKSVSVSVLSKGINKRYEGFGGKYGYKRCEIEINKRKYPVTLVVYQGKWNNEALMLLCSGEIRKSSEAKRLIDGYFKRWGIEECYKFLKQSFGLEKAQLRRFDGIKCLLGMTLLAWQILWEIEQDIELALILKKEAKSTSKKEITFTYYRLLKGVSTVLQSRKELFRFRQKKVKTQTQITVFDLLSKYNEYTMC